MVMFAIRVLGDIMTIQEAIRTGLPFKREDWKIYITVQYGRLTLDQQIEEDILYAEDILATDWEVKEIKNEQQD